MGWVFGEEQKALFSKLQEVKESFKSKTIAPSLENGERFSNEVLASFDRVMGKLDTRFTFSLVAFKALSDEFKRLADKLKVATSSLPNNYKANDSNFIKICSCLFQLELKLNQAIEDPKGSKELAQALATQLSEAQGHLEAAKVHQGGIKTLLENTQAINEAHNLICVTDGEHLSKQEEINRAKVSIDEILRGAGAVKVALDAQAQAINEAHNLICVTDGEHLSKQEEINRAKVSIDEILRGAGAVKQSLDSQATALMSYYAQIFGSPGKDGRPTDIGLKQEIENRIAELAAMKSDWQAEYTRLRDEIENLLPGATDAAFASAFQKRKDGVERRIRQWNYGFWILLFVLLGAICYEMNTVPAITDWSPGTLLTLLTRASLVAALSFGLWFVSKRRSELMRLSEEYAHKEAVAMISRGYRDLVSQKDEKNSNYDGISLTEDLLSRAIKTMDYNPSQTLDGKHGEHPLEFLTSSIQKIMKEKPKLFEDFISRLTEEASKKEGAEGK